MALMQRGLNGVYTRLGHRLLDMGRGTALFGDGTCIYSECRLQGNGQMRGIFEGAFLQPQAPAAIALTSEQKNPRNVGVGGKHRALRETAIKYWLSFAGRRAIYHDIWPRPVPDPCNHSAPAGGQPLRE